MRAVCKILFDMSFYYALSGYYLYLFTLDQPASWGVPVLVLSLGAYIALRRWKPDYRVGSTGKKLFDPVTIICCALPGLLFLTGPTIPQITQFAPAWGYLCFTLWTDRIHTNRTVFREHFSLTIRLFLLIIPGLIAIGRIGGAFESAIPYVVIYLVAGVLLMRILREDGNLPAGRNFAIILGLLLLSVAFVFLQAPQLVLAAARFVYEYVFVWIVMAGIYAVWGISRAIYWFLSLFVEFGEVETGEIDMGDEGMGENRSPTWLWEFPPWVEVAGIIVFSLAMVIFAILVLRRLLGNRAVGIAAAPYTEELEKLQKTSRGRMGGLLRPKDPRQAVRWYYRKYLKEGVSRGAEPVPADTSLSIWRKFCDYFSKSESGKLRSLYIVSRYRYSEDITKEDADMASTTWRKLK